MSLLHKPFSDRREAGRRLAERLRPELQPLGAAADAPPATP